MEIGKLNHRAEPPQGSRALDSDKRAQQERGANMGVAETARQKLNMAILNSSSDVTLSSGNQPLHLLFRSAIESLNEILAPELGEGAIERAAENPEDFTPENTAERVASFALNFYSAYRQQHPEMQEEESVNSFINLMTGAVEQGVNEARDILDGMRVLEGEIETNIDKTLGLIRERFEVFRESMTGADEPVTNR